MSVLVVDNNRMTQWDVFSRLVNEANVWKLTHHICLIDLYSKVCECAGQILTINNMIWTEPGPITPAITLKLLFCTAKIERDVRLPLIYPERQQQMISNAQLVDVCVSCKAN